MDYNEYRKILIEFRKYVFLQYLKSERYYELYHAVKKKMVKNEELFLRVFETVYSYENIAWYLKAPNYNTLRNFEYFLHRNRKRLEKELRVKLHYNL